MLAKRLFQKAIHHHHNHQLDSQQGTLQPTELDARILLHYGVPSTASVLAVDPIQRLLAAGTLDGRIKVIGGTSIEGLFISPKQLPYKNLEFLQNEGYLVGILNDNDIQVWNLERRCITSSLQWRSNITAFSVIPGSLLMLVGDEHGTVSVLKYAIKNEKLVDMPYHISPDCLVEKDQASFLVDQPVVGVLPQPCSLGNRLLIAFQYGLIILWDIPEAKVVAIKGDKDLQLKDDLRHSPSTLDPFDNELEHMNEKEISALCWASSSGWMVAVGYVDGDIFLWDMSGDALPKGKTGGDVSSKDVVKLQLVSSGKRLPVITLHWSSISENSCEGQLFVYGGSEIGSEEVITVVSLQWSPDMEILKNIRRVDIALVGFFADMISFSSRGPAGKNHFDGLLVLTSPGKLEFHAVATLDTLFSSQERKSSVSGLEPPVIVPISNPQMTASKICWLPSDATLSMLVSEIASGGSILGPAEIRTWPLSGGTHADISNTEEKLQKSIYIVGYGDGSVRIWDATNPTLSLLSVLESQLLGIENACPEAAVTKLDFCASTMSLAVGTHCGTVCVYSLHNNAEGTKLHLIKQSAHQVIDVLPRKGLQCRAVISLVNSQVRSLQFSALGAKLAVGFESGHVAVLDMILFSVLFVTDPLPSSKCPVISVILRSFLETDGLNKDTTQSGATKAEQPLEELTFSLTQDAKVNIIDSRTGTPISSQPLHLKKKLTAISMYVLGGSNFMSASSSHQHEQSSKGTTIPQESSQDGSSKKGDIKGSTHLPMEGGSLLGSLLLLCGESKLRLYDMKAVLQGEDKPTYKVKLGNTCCWTSLLNKDDKICGLIMLYNSGAIEVRSLPDLKLVTDSSLVSILRWNFRPNMEKLMSSLDDGRISLVNGCELAFISLSFCGETRLVESLPLLHDKAAAAAAAADATIRHSEKQKKQVPIGGVLGGIVKGFKKEKSKNAIVSCDLSQLEEIFSRPVTSGAVENMEEEEEELDIDDIDIDDEPLLVASSSSHQGKGKQTATDRERLFQGSSVDIKPRTRTTEEIMAAYRGPEYAAAAAENARNKLLERQEKLERINQRTEDLRSEAEDFASMANELVKTMEAKKWWKL